MTYSREVSRARTWLGALILIVALAGIVSPAQGQKETERFIPIGQSPGLSLVQTSIGEITEVNQRQQAITIADSAGQHTVRITGATRIWLDRTRTQQMNLTGSFADLQVGRRVEVKYLAPERRDVAEWVKVEIAQS